eukprot:275523_1
MSVPVPVQSGIEPMVDTYYNVTFTINTLECNRPSIDFLFEPSGNYNSGRALYVSAPGLSTQTCGGHSSFCRYCCWFFTCFSQMSVNNDLPIAIGQSITVTIQRNRLVGGQQCDGENDVNAIVKLHCDDTTTNPTLPSQPPSHAPTSSPSVAPSRSPVQPPSHAPTSSPFAAPSRSPSQPPSHTPTSSPSVAPSATPSQQPSHAPTSSPTSITAVPTGIPSGSPTQPSQPPTRTPTVIGYQYPTTAPSWDASCSSNTMDSLPFSSYIQTFDASSIITNDQLKITEITINYHYETQVAPVHFVFKLEVFVPHYLDRFYRYDHVDYKFATAQTPVTLTETMPTQGLLQVTFSNLDITLGCNERYHVNGYQGRFAIYAYPTNCVNDDKCEQLSDIWPRTCNMTSGDETLFIYDNGNYVPADLERLLDWPDDPTERNDLRMSFDIVYANSIDCTCDTSIEMARGDCGKPDHPLSWPVSQAFRTDCFSSQHLDFIHIMIGWGVDNMGAIAPPNETFTLVIEDTSTYSGTTIDTMQLPWSSSIINGTGGSDTYHTETIAFPITLSDLFIGSCDRELQWTLSCANCSLQSFYQQTPFVVSCDTALHMAHDFANPQPPEYGEGFDAWDGYYAAFQLGTDAAFTCPSGTPCLPFDQCPTEAPTSAQPSNTPTFKPTSFPSISPVTP